jgi:hypothetical protein
MFAVRCQPATVGAEEPPLSRDAAAAADVGGRTVQDEGYVQIPPPPGGQNNSTVSKNPENKIKCSCISLPTPAMRGELLCGDTQLLNYVTSICTGQINGRSLVLAIVCSADLAFSLTPILSWGPTQCQALLTHNFKKIKISGWGTMIQTGRSWVRHPMRQIMFLIYLILPATLGHGVRSASIRNEHQKQRNNISGE